MRRYFFILLLLFLAAIASLLYIYRFNYYGESVALNTLLPTSTQQFKSQGLMKVHFIDVGQADSILIQTADGKNILIDAGFYTAGSTVFSYLKSRDISKIDTVIFTHPHNDHIGGMLDVIHSFDIGTVYAPFVPGIFDVFEENLEVIMSKGLTVCAVSAGDYLDLASTIKVEVLAPNGSNYENLNNYSLVLKVTYGEVSFLLAGDAQSVSEKEMLDKGFDLKADVLKVGHHGSSDSTTPEFLRAVSPRYAVISVVKDSPYGHPHGDVLDTLRKSGVKVYRTDEYGSVVVRTDGVNVSFSEE
ncbi:MAG: MBL fold metallo-hydrolase [Clostridia bacterium]|nr:MBL fold metallo-hydrolase [Clostridia bacterium]